MWWDASGLDHIQISKFSEHCVYHQIGGTHEADMQSLPSANEFADRNNIVESVILYDQNHHLII